MDSALRPREIQTRIRSGESPESVASAAGMTLERIMPFAGPVLAERAHVAERAQRSSLRRASSEPSAARTLGDAVSGRLRAVDVSPDTVAWDSWKRADGRWTLTGDFAVGDQSGTARFAFDAPGNFVTCENDEARWLVGDAEAVSDDPVSPRRPLAPVLAEVPAEDAPLGDDVIRMVRDPSEPAREAGRAGREPAREPGPDDSTLDLTEAAAGLRDAHLGLDTPLESFLDDPAGSPSVAGPADEAGSAGAAGATAAGDAERPTEPPTRRPVRKTRGRASVPSWDEIMFGGSE